MRRLTILIAALALVWGGYWWSGASAFERGARGWLDARAAEGWTAAYASVETHGFPSRFDTTITGLALGDPAGAWLWEAPFVQLLMLSYAPNRAVLAWPHEQSLTLGGARAEIRSEKMTASVRLAPEPALPLDAFTAIAERLAVEAGAGWRTGAREARLATRRTEALENGQNLGLLLTDLILPEGARAAVDPGGRLPERIDLVRIDADLGLDAPWTPLFPGPRPPRPTALALREARMEWGGIAAIASGRIDLDAAGIPEGRIDLRVENWRPIPALLAATGLIDPAAEGAATQAMEALAALGGEADAIDAPLVFEEGRMRIGPVPLGAAPRLAVPSLP